MAHLQQYIEFGTERHARLQELATSMHICGEFNEYNAVEFPQLFGLIRKELIKAGCIKTDICYFSREVCITSYTRLV